ncbi:MAG: Crp/Fnr family transcriptional regulator, partial [Ekhidna sp.]
TQFIKLLSKNLSDREHELMELAYNTVRKRTADALYRLYKTYHSDSSTTNFDISRADLASIVGTATESVIRILSEFKRDKWITIDGSNITINEPEKIKEVQF